VWPQSAALHGALVNNSPTVGSVAEWDGGSSGIPYPGHVAIVEAIGPRDSYIVISQQNVADVNDFDWIRINSDGLGNEWEQWPSHFVHFTSAQGSLRVSAKSSVVNIIVKTTPASFSDDVFAFSNGHQHLVTPGLSTGSNAEIPSGEYRVGFHDASLGDRYVLHVAVNGPNVKILHQGGPYSTSLPRIGIASSRITQLPSVVTITVGPGRLPLTTATTSPSSPTSKMAVAPTTTTSMPS
jgi:surface antigen